MLLETIARIGTLVASLVTMSFGIAVHESKRVNKAAEGDANDPSRIEGDAVRMHYLWLGSGFLLFCSSFLCFVEFLRSNRHAKYHMARVLLWCAITMSWLGLLFLIFDIEPLGAVLPCELLALLFLGLSSVLAHVLLPIVSFPRPSGPFHVGTDTLTVHDSSREWSKYPGGSAVGDTRILNMQVWYPVPAGHGHPRGWQRGSHDAHGSEKSHLDGCPRAVYGDHEWGMSFAGIAGIPFYIISHLTLIRTRAHVGALPFCPPTGSTGVPVIVFSHGHVGWKAQNTALVEDLASRGYIVLACDHFGDSCTSDPFLGTSAPGRSEEGERAYYRCGFDDRVQDLSFMVDAFTAIAADRFSHDGPNIPENVKRIAKCGNFSRVGAVGHSFGGGTACLFAERDDRCAAAVGLDSWLWPLNTEHLDGSQEASPRAPTLLLSATDWALGYGSVKNRKLIVSSRPGSRTFNVLNTNHHNFNDIHMLLGKVILRKKNKIGAADNMVCLRLICDLTSSWFDLALRGGKPVEALNDDQDGDSAENSSLLVERADGVQSFDAMLAKWKSHMVPAEGDRDFSTADHTEVSSRSE